MATYEMGYSGIGNVTATFKLDEATKTAIGKNYADAFGKCVALNENDTVGFGTEAGSPLFGFIVFADARGIAGVTVTGFFEGAPIKKFGSSPAYPSIGEIGLGVDNLGNVVKLAAGKRGVLTSIASTAGTTSTATILL